MQRKEAARSGRTAAQRPPSYPVYTPPTRPAVPETYDSYEAEKKTFAKYGYIILPRNLLTEHVLTDGFF